MVDDAKERLYMKDLYCSYYTESDEITSYMISKLNIKDNDIILEPSAGEGIFIDGIINQQKNVQIDALDINEKAVNILKKKYWDMPNVKVRLTDTLLDRQLDMYADRQLWLKITDTLEDKELDYISDNGGYYDKIIGNPPYGAWQDYDKRKILKKKYKGQYVKETYTLFLYRCIFLLKKGGKLSFIIPDTFLFLNMHKSLREFLLKSTKIEEILIFPSNFFPGVNFGYSNLSIITLEKDDCESVKDNDVKIFTGFKTVRELGRIDENSENLQCFCYKQSDILKNENYKFIITDNSQIAIINDSKVRIGDVADVVTGFSLCILLVVVFGISKNTYIPLIIGHTVLSAPFVYLAVVPKLKQMDPSLYEAALDLGATPGYTLIHIIIPQIASGIVSGFVMAVTLSLDDYFVATYTKPATFDTISTYVVNATKGSQTNIKTALWALSTIIFLIVVIVEVVMNFAPIKNEAQKEKH